MAQRPESELVASKQPCPCGKSSDAYATYSDGHGFCFSCSESFGGEAPAAVETRAKAKGLIPFDHWGALPTRKLTEETCKRYGYFLADNVNEQPAQVAPIRNLAGEVIGQKVRQQGKKFFVTGTAKGAAFFGQHLFRDKGKMVVITEGEIDAMTGGQLMKNWPVVSVVNGAAGAAKDVKNNLEWLLGYDNIVLFFDDDEAGHRALEECAPLLPPGRVKVARVPGYKDASEAFVAGKGEAVVNAIWEAKTWRPDGILQGEDLWDRYVEEVSNDTAAASYPWEGVNRKTLGLRPSELVVITAGSGVGKSAVVREIAHSLLKDGDTVGLLMLEESTSRTLNGLIGIELNLPVHLDMTPWLELSEAKRAARRGAFERIGGSSRLHLYDHFGSTDVDNLINRVRFLVTALGCKWVILDHISIVVSGSDNDDERKAIDMIMTKLRTLVQETKCGLIVVSHLRRPAGDKGHEEGAITSLSQLRGSHAIAQLADAVIGLERNQQNPESSDVTTVRVLKCRFSGDTGVACHLFYDRDTGRLSELDEEPDEAPAAPKSARKGEF